MSAPVIPAIASSGSDIYPGRKIWAASARVTTSIAYATLIQASLRFDHAYVFGYLDRIPYFRRISVTGPRGSASTVAAREETVVALNSEL